jgi:serine/threonine-protein kinase HipA
MTDSLIATFQDTTAGTVTRLHGGRLRFDYDDDYRKSPGATPLSVSMPLQVRSHPDHVISPWLWGLLPDNEAVLARWARQFHASASSPFSMLSTPIGHDVAGAVRLTAPDVLDEVMGRPGTVAWLTDDDVAQRLRELREDSTSWLGRTSTGQFSLAGAQAKTALLLKDGRWGQPSGPIATSHILKPAVAGLDDHDLNEHLCLDAARRAGLLVARTRVTQFGAESAIVVDRYDRRIVGDTVIRIHQEDLCQALSVLPSKKYQNEGGPGSKEIVKLMRQSIAPRFVEESTFRFLDALAWNWLIGGTDAHAKNYSFLLAGDEVRLAPLYDIASALPYGMHERKLHFAMKIGGDYRVYLHHNTWPALAADLDLDNDLVMERVAGLAQRGPDAFADAAAAVDIEMLDRPLSHRLVDLVADRSERCLQILGDTTTAN